MDQTPNSYPEAVEELIAALRKLPGIGRRGAERMALGMLKFSAEELELFGNTIADLPRRVFVPHLRKSDRSR